jgi:hypothetical protein
VATATPNTASAGGLITSRSPDRCRGAAVGFDALVPPHRFRHPPAPSFAPSD